MKSTYIPILALLLIALILVSGCTTQENKIEKGFLEGKITIGPICPVERFPPDPNCQPTEETYKAWQIAVWSEDKTMIAKIEPDLNGSYKMELPAGSYEVNFENEKQHALGGNNLPATVKINPRETTTLDIDIDTGIR